MCRRGEGILLTHAEQQQPRSANKLMMGEARAWSSASPSHPAIPVMQHWVFLCSLPVTFQKLESLKMYSAESCRAFVAHSSCSWIEGWAGKEAVAPAVRPRSQWDQTLVSSPAFPLQPLSIFSSVHCPLHKACFFPFRQMCSPTCYSHRSFPSRVPARSNGKLKQLTGRSLWTRRWKICR